jgi:hypothetical protein
MTSTQASIIIKNGLNKLDSGDHKNITLEKMEEAINLSTKRFVRERIEAKEINIKLTDDLQVLLKPEKLSGSNKDTYFLSHKLPSDYFGTSRVTPICEKGECLAIRIKSDLIEDGNVDEFLQDDSSQPSFEFEQCFYVISSNKVKLYHNNDFKVKEIELSYYKQPQYITFPGAYQFDGSRGKDMVWEFKDDVCDLIIEGAIKIISGNVKNIDSLDIRIWWC